jgi:tetratricopeptide (TPR) repeat protein
MNTQKIKYGLIALLVCMALVGCKSKNIERGSLCLRLGDYPMAIAFFTQEVQRRPDSYEARLGLGKALLQQAFDRTGDTLSWKNALIQLEAARTLSASDTVRPLLSQAYLEHAHVLLLRRDSLAALEALVRAIEYNNRAIEPVNLAGIVYFRMGEVDKAEMLFNRAIALDSGSAAARFNLGMVCWQRGQYDEARAFWFRALSASPADKDLIYWCAVAEKKCREKGK